MRKLLRHIVVFALMLEAKLVLKKYKPKIVAVTGSVGKTSTKDAIYATLSQTYFARKSEKSFNSEIGVPLTILGLPNAWSSALGWLENIVEGFHLLLTKTPYPEWLILEVGADRPGDIRNMRWLRPHIVVYTRFPDVPVHVEYFDNPEQVIQEKCELGKALRANGTLVINGDDEKMKEITVKEGQHLLSCGIGEHASVRCINTKPFFKDGLPAGMSCTVQFQNQQRMVSIPGIIGAHHLQPVLAAITVAVSEGVSFEHSVDYVQTYSPPQGRMCLLSGIHGSILIDDSYNSSPVAVTAGLTALSELTVSGKKIAILGDMMELGEYSMKEHQLVGKRAAATAHILVAVGVRMRGAADAARELGGICKEVISVQDAYEALNVIKDKVNAGDCVYIKGSQSMRMERVVEGLMADPSRAGDLLVRQDEQWKIKK